MNPAVQTLLEEIAQAKRRAAERKQHAQASGDVPSTTHVPQEPQPPSADECCGNGCTPCVYDTYRAQLAAYHQAKPPPFIPATVHVRSSQPLGARARLLVLDASEQTFPVRLGQHVHLRTEGTAARAFTPVMLPDATGTVRPHVLVRVYGPGSSSRSLAELRPGDPLMVRGPLESSVDMPGALNSSTCVLVAAGSGISAVFHVLQYAAAHAEYHRRRLLVVQCACDAESLWLRRPIERLRDVLPGLHYHAHVSADAGRMDCHMLRGMLGDVDGACAVVCGPEAFNND
ncbi:NADH-cytochrome b5 reductase-like, partial [Coemansia sp. RSA 2603]